MELNGSYFIKLVKRSEELKCFLVFSRKFELNGSRFIMISKDQQKFTRFLVFSDQWWFHQYLYYIMNPKRTLYNDLKKDLFTSYIYLMKFDRNSSRN